MAMSSNISPEIIKGLFERETFSVQFLAVEDKQIAEEAVARGHKVRNKYYVYIKDMIIVPPDPCDGAPVMEASKLAKESVAALLAVATGLKLEVPRRGWGLAAVYEFVAAGRPTGLAWCVWRKRSRGHEVMKMEIEVTDTNGLPLLIQSGDAAETNVPASKATQATTDKRKTMATNEDGFHERARAIQKEIERQYDCESGSATAPSPSAERMPLSTEIIRAIVEREKFPWSLLFQVSTEVVEQTKAKKLPMSAATTESAQSVIVAAPDPHDATPVLQAIAKAKGKVVALVTVKLAFELQEPIPKWGLTYVRELTVSGRSTGLAWCTWEYKCNGWEVMEEEIPIGDASGLPLVEPTGSAAIEESPTNTPEDGRNKNQATESIQYDADHPECPPHDGEKNRDQIQSDASGLPAKRNKSPTRETTQDDANHPECNGKNKKQIQPDDAKYSRMFRTAEQCKMRPIGWLVPGYIPLRNITLFHGQGETCKSLMAIYLASKISRGERLEFDKSNSAPVDGDVLILAHEDTAEEIIKPRLSVAGADMTRIHFRAAGQDIRLPEDIKALKWLIRQHSIKLLIIDTLDDFSSKSTKNNQSVRAILNALGNLAEQEDIAIVIITHWTKQKSNKGSLRAKIAGSFGILARGRCAYAFVADPDSRGILMLSTKGNMGGRKPTVLFDVDIEEIEIDGELVEQPKVFYVGQTKITEDDFEGGTSRVDDAVKYLEDTLRSGPVDSREIMANSPVSRQTLFLAKKIVGIADSRQGQGKDHRCYWALPDGYFADTEKQGDGGSNGASQNNLLSPSAESQSKATDDEKLESQAALPPERQ